MDRTELLILDGSRPGRSMRPTVHTTRGKDTTDAEHRSSAIGNRSHL